MLRSFKVSVQCRPTLIIDLPESEQLSYWVSYIRDTRTQHRRSSLTACLKLEKISPLLAVIPSQTPSCVTTCMTTRALARLHVSCGMHASRYYRVKPLLRRTSLKDREPHHSTSTVKYHRSSPIDDEFHVSIRSLGFSPNYVAFAFSLK